MQLTKAPHALAGTTTDAGSCHLAWRRWTAKLGALVTLATIVASSFGHADDVTRTWTGSVEARGNYYWERSTRVMAPAIRLLAQSPSGIELQADYLVDAITSASVGSGLVSDVRFTEVRHEAGLGIAHEFKVGGLPLRLGLQGRFSYEPDYLSRGVGTTAALSLNRRATVLQLGMYYTNDDVGRVLRGLPPRPSGGSSTSNRQDVGTLNGLSISAAVGHALSPVLLVGGGYDFGYANGFLANPYRVVVVDGTPLSEHHPDDRLRHTLHGRVEWYIPKTRTALHAIPRLYADSWNVFAINPEVRLYQELGDYAQLRLRYRHYQQTQSFFYQAGAMYTSSQPYRTADPKMSAFRNDLVGLQMLVLLGFLADTPLDFLTDGTLDVSFEYIFNTNRYGNGVIAQTGVRVPF